MTVVNCRRTSLCLALCSPYLNAPLLSEIIIQACIIEVSLQL